jgi:predicted protein tyrosine phosphatase
MFAQTRAGSDHGKAMAPRAGATAPPVHSAMSGVREFTTSWPQGAPFVIHGGAAGARETARAESRARRLSLAFAGASQ